MENNEIQKVVHGFKVFNPDWTCSPNGNTKQYTCPGKFEEEGELAICVHGMHFCENAADCFNYYSFDSRNHVAEVIAYGQVQKYGKKSCTDKLEIVREIPWEEVLRIVNIGKDCTGIYNTGDRNTGICNTGNSNTGNSNTGKCNTGNCNTGDCNTGNWNTGNWNTGAYNTGKCNTGAYNTGKCNTGNWNTGNCNTGNCNTGDWNKSSFNTGCFMTKEQKIFMFNKPSEWTYQDWIRSEARHLLNQIPNVVEWIYSSDMTDEEKAEYPTHETTGGYLKVLNESDCGQLWWSGLSACQKNIIKSMPNFDAAIFEQCTGVKVDE